MAQSSSWYDAHAADLVHRYELIDPATMYGWLSGLLSDATGTVLDVGAGSGRDAAWFAAQGHDVIAVEPSSLSRLWPHRCQWGLRYEELLEHSGRNVCGPQAMRLLELGRIDLVRRRYQPTRPRANIVADVVAGGRSIQPSLCAHTIGYGVIRT